MKRFLREQSLSLVFLALFVAALAGQAVAGWHGYNDDEVKHAAAAGRVARDDQLRPLPHVVVLRPGRHGELAVGVPAVHALHPRHRLVRPEGLDRVQAAGRGGRRERRASRCSAGTPSPTRRAGRARAAGGLASTRTRWCSSWPRSGSGRGSAQSVTGWSEYNAEQLEHEQRAALLAAVPRLGRLLGDDAAELAVGVPGGRLDGRAGHLPAPARLAGVQAGRVPASLDGRGGIGTSPKPSARNERLGRQAK